MTSGVSTREPEADFSKSQPPYCVLDAVVLLTLPLALVTTHLAFSDASMPLDESSRYFHFGHRTITGAAPYRDFEFPYGPLPVYVDAGFQRIFGAGYVASQWAALAIDILRCFMTWVTARRLGSPRIAALLAVSCALDPMFRSPHHGATPYVQLVAICIGLSLWQSARHRTRVGSHFALAGLLFGVLLSAQPDVSIFSLPVLLIGATVIAAREGTMSLRRCGAIWGGAVLGGGIVAGCLFAGGVMDPAIRQMFVDAPARWGGLFALVKAALGDTTNGTWSELLYLCAIPAVIVICTIRILVKGDRIPISTIGLMMVPAGILFALAFRLGPLNLLSDLPRFFLLIVAAIAITAPSRARTWFGVEPIVALGFAALPLASDWALAVSSPGRGPADSTSLFFGVIFLVLASRHLTRKTKEVVSAAVAATAIVHIATSLFTLREPTAVEWMQRSRTLSWLRHRVPADSTCFIYGDMPALYTILGCRNPTRVDSTALVSTAEMEATTTTLMAAPPEYLIVQESVDGARLAPATLVAHYTSVGKLRELFGPQFDGLDLAHLYRRTQGSGTPDRSE